MHGSNRLQKRLNNINIQIIEQIQIILLYNYHHKHIVDTKHVIAAVKRMVNAIKNII